MKPPGHRRPGRTAADPLAGLARQATRDTGQLRGSQEPETQGRPPQPTNAREAVTGAVDAWQGSRVTKTMWPPQPGTVRFTQEHGPRLVCVRYRQDANGLRRYTTIELIVDKALVNSPKARRQKLEVAIAYEEVELRAMARELGAQWNPRKRVWELTGDVAQRLRLTHRAKRRDDKA